MLLYALIDIQIDIIPLILADLYSKSVKLTARSFGLTKNRSFKFIAFFKISEYILDSDENDSVEFDN
ncbi:hypothetical protein BpHYR1_033699 [Brachionus plicatilis]|uniref:Uncharacterized protein n=1 Tax=Brachionus plicatilis TaxID=10195 RepID=A0A3M7SKP3_BRAPC|nr:hypothetical protein BpHYR1_033699 [Brachionus plicatilis]